MVTAKKAAELRQLLERVARELNASMPPEVEWEVSVTEDEAAPGVPEALELSVVVSTEAWTFDQAQATLMFKDVGEVGFIVLGCWLTDAMKMVEELLSPENGSSCLLLTNRLRSSFFVAYSERQTTLPKQASKELPS